jgi:hypothetical protein
MGKTECGFASYAKLISASNHIENLRSSLIPGRDTGALLPHWQRCWKQHVTLCFHASIVLSCTIYGYIG